MDPLERRLFLVEVSKGVAIVVFKQPLALSSCKLFLGHSRRALETSRVFVHFDPVANSSFGLVEDVRQMPAGKPRL